MAICLLSPNHGRRPSRNYELTIAPDVGRHCVVLCLVREDGQRSYYLAEPDAALDAALQLVGSTMRLRDMQVEDDQ